MTRRSPAYYLWFLLSVSGCSCEFHAGTSHSTSSGGERTAADIERDRLRQEQWERERQARHQREIERERNRPHVSGPPPAPTHVTGQAAPAAAPRHAPPLPAGSTGSTPAVGAQPTPTPVVPTPVVAQPPAPVAQPTPVAPPAPPPAPAPSSEPAPAAPSDNFVQARDPSARPDTTGQRPGTAGAPANNQPRRVPRGTLAPK